jgi:hypothetical protein
VYVYVGVLSVYIHKCVCVRDTLFQKGHDDPHFILLGYVERCFSTPIHPLIIWMDTVSQRLYPDGVGGGEDREGFVPAIISIKRVWW